MMSPISQRNCSETDLVVVVPGLDVRRPGEGLERVIDGLEGYMDSRSGPVVAHRIATRQGEGVGQAMVEIQLADGTERRLEVRELAWTDLRPSMKDVSVYTRVWRGARLVGYWGGVLLFGSMPRTSNSIRGWFLFGLISLVMWYALFLAASYHLVQPQIHDFLWSGSKMPAGAERHSLLTELLWAAVLVTLGFKMVTDGVDLAWSTYSFMMNDSVLRRKLRLRLRGMLSNLGAGEHRYRRIILLAHSFGTAIAADSLGADEKDGALIPELELITLGSPLEFLACRDPQMQTLVERCLHAPQVRSWSDFYAEADAFCSKIPLTDGAAGKFASYKVPLTLTFKSMIGCKHNVYFESLDVLDWIIGAQKNVHASDANDKKNGCNASKPAFVSQLPS